MAKADKNKGTVSRSQDNVIDLKLTGSQINLQERPRSNSSSAYMRYSSRNSVHSMKRPVSATPHLGYYQNTMRRMVNWSRPQSAEASTFGPRRNKLAANFRQNTPCLDEHEFGLALNYSGSNMLLSDSDSDLMSSSNQRQIFTSGDYGIFPNEKNITLAPGLSSKPPLPPSCELKPDADAANKSIDQRPDNTIIDMNMSDEENLDDIVSLKFQRWFPNSRSDKSKMVLERKGTKTDSIEMFSYHERKYEVRNFTNTESLIDFGNDIDDEELLRDDDNHFRAYAGKGQVRNSAEMASSYDTSRAADSSKHDDLKATDSLVRRNHSYDSIRQNQQPFNKNENNSSSKNSSKNIESLNLITPSSSNIYRKPDSLLLHRCSESNAKSGIVENTSACHVNTDTKSDETSILQGKQPSGVSSKDQYFMSTPTFTDGEPFDTLKRDLNRSAYEVNNNFLAKFDKGVSQGSNGSICDMERIQSSSGYSTGKASSEIYSYTSNVHSKDDENRVVEEEKDSTRLKKFQFSESDNFSSPSSQQSVKREATAVSPDINRKPLETSEATDHYAPSIFPFQYSTEVHTMSTVVINGEHIRHQPVIGFSEKDDCVSHEYKPAKPTETHFNGENSNDFKSRSFQPEATKLSNYAFQTNSGRQNIVAGERIEEVTKVVIDGCYSNEIYYSFDHQSSPTEFEKRTSPKGCDTKRGTLSTNLPSSSKCSGRPRREMKSNEKKSDFTAWVSPKGDSGEFKNRKSESPAKRHLRYSPANSSQRRTETDFSQIENDIPEKDLNNIPLDELIDVIKAIEEDEKDTEMNLDSCDGSAKTKRVHNSSAIWSYLDELDRNTFVESSPVPINASTPHKHPKGLNTRLSKLVCLSNAELAQQVMTLSLQVEDMEIALESSAKRMKEMQQSLKKQKEESEDAIKRHQQFIDQLLKEKQTLSKQCSSIIGEMEKKHSSTLKSIEDRYKVEMKRQEDKFAAAEKIRKEKWIDSKTQKIKELTVKSLEPELNRMAEKHQEELTEMKKIYQRQLEQQEEMCTRRLNALKEKMESEKENALTIEKDAARHRLENELSELEKSYQEQRKKLIGDLHTERENMEKETENLLHEKERELEQKWKQKERELEQKWTMKQKQLDERLEAHETQYQTEIKSIENSLKLEKERWKENESCKLAEKEKVIREQCKRERDRHIEFIIGKLEYEASQREQAIENKLKRLKDQFEKELDEHEKSGEAIRKKLNEVRNCVREKEEVIMELKTQFSQAQSDNKMLKELCDRLTMEQSEARKSASKDMSTQITHLQHQLAQMRLNHEAEINAIKNENEWELSQVYSRVKDAVAKKEEVINLLQKQKAVALSKCNHLEKIIEERSMVQT